MNNEKKRGKFLKSLRLKYNLKQKELSALINYSDKAISKWERGICFPNNPDVIISLADLFNVSVEEILNGEYSKEKCEKKINFSCNYLLFFKCFIFKFQYLFILLLIGVVGFSIYHLINNNSLNLLIENIDNKFNEIHTSDIIDSNISNTNYSKLIEIGFIKDEFYYYKILNGNTYIYFNDFSKNIKINFSRDNTLYNIYNELEFNYFFIESNYENNIQTFNIESTKIKNCNNEICDSYEDYIMYINYIKNEIKN